MEVYEVKPHTFRVAGRSLVIHIKISWEKPLENL